MNADPVWILDDPEERPRVRAKSAAAPSPQKNPATAFTLSLLIWGAGQFYNRQGALGALFILLMVNFYADPILVWVYRESLLPWLGDAITTSRLLMAGGTFYVVGLMIWLFNAAQAYYRSNATRTEVFRGIDGAFLPAACSLIVPGWGQFLNGQAIKGTLLLIVALIGSAAVPAVLLLAVVWSSLDTAARVFWEPVLAAALALAAPMVLLYPLGSFDAWKVARDDTKKEPLLKRLEYANNRRRMYGWIRGVYPSCKSTLILGVFLAICATAAYGWFPRAYYRSQLHDLQTRLSQQHLVLIPRLIDRILHDRRR